MLHGRSGSDTLDGGGGNDTADYSESDPGNEVRVNLTTGQALDGHTQTTWAPGVDPLTHPGTTTAFVDTLISIEHVIGGRAADGIVGTDAANFLFGGGFAADGSFLLASGADTLEGGAGDDGLWGADGNDALFGGGGSDGIVGGAGNDSLDGGEGTDFLFGGEFGWMGTFVPGSGDDWLQGGNGNDGLWGFDGNDTVNGDAGDDYAEGGVGNDILLGGAGNDTLLGRSDNDTVGGGTGFDYLYGGLGADVFVFSSGDSYDTVWDFSAAAGDRIRLDPSLGIASFADLQSHLSGFNFEGADYTVISFAGGLDQLTIKGIAATAWTADLLA